MTKRNKMDDKKIIEFLEKQLKFNEENEKLKKQNKELKDRLIIAQNTIIAQKETLDIYNELRWSLSLKIKEMETDNWRKNK